MANGTAQNVLHYGYDSFYEDQEEKARQPKVRLPVRFTPGKTCWNYFKSEDIAGGDFALPKAHPTHELLPCCKDSNFSELQEMSKNKLEDCAIDGTIWIAADGFASNDLASNRLKLNTKHSQSPQDTNTMQFA